MPNQPIAFVGDSGSGKTTLICGLIRLVAERKESVAVLKHTHHEVTSERRGDTERFLEAGATEAVLADGFKAVHFGSMGTSEWAYSHPTDLMRLIRAPVIFVEGFKAFPGWPKVLMEPSHSLLASGRLQNVVAVVGTGPVATKALRLFAPGQFRELLDFLDRITLP